MATDLPPFATSEQLSALTGLAASPASDQTLMAVSTEIRRYCGWHIAPVLTTDMTLDGCGGVDQPLPTLRVVAVQSVTEAGTDVPTDTLEWSAAGFLRKSTGWTTRLRGLYIVLQHGWDLADVADLTLLTCVLAGRVLAAPTGVSQMAVGSVSLSLASDPITGIGSPALSDSQRDIVDAYKLPWRN